MLQKQHIDIMLDKGIEGQVDSKLVEGKNLVVENAKFNKLKALQKCKGHTIIGHDDFDSNDLSGTIKGIFRAGNRLLGFDSSRNFYTYHEKTDSWELLEGCKFPAKTEITGVDYSGYTQNNPDIKYNSRLGLTATVYDESILNASFDTRIMLSVHYDDDRDSRKIHAGFGKNARLAIVDDGTDVYFVIVRCASAYALLRVYDINLELVHSETIGNSSSDSVISLDQNSNEILLCYCLGAKIETARFDFNFADVTTQTITKVSNTLSVGFDYTNMYGLNCKIYDGNYYFAYVGTGNDARIFATESDLSTSVVDEASFGTLSSGDPHLIDVIITATNIYAFIETSETVFTDSISTYVKGLAVVECTVSGTTLTVGDDYYGNGMHMRSRPYYDSTNEKFYCVLAWVSDLQSTNFICEISLEEAINSVTDATTNAAKAKVLAKTTKGLASRALSAYMIPSFVMNGNDLYTVVERTRRYNPESSVQNDGSSIEIVKTILDDFTFQVDEFGKTSLIAAGIVLDSDGFNILENGFFINPEIFEVVEDSAGSIEAGTRSYKILFEYYNKFGELTRSAPSPSFSITNAASKKNLVSWIIPPFGERLDNRSKVLIYRTVASGTVHYKVNEFETSAPTDSFFQWSTFDDVADADLTNNEILYTSGGELENDSAPSAKSIAVVNNRVLLGDIDNYNEIAYSKLGVYEVAPSFSDYLRITVDNSGINKKGFAEIVAGIDDKIIIFKKSAIYYTIGDGPDNNGLNDNFTEPESISQDVGCVDKNSVVNTVNGLIFKSAKGFYLLDKGLSLNYIGNSMYEYNDDNIVSRIVVESENEVRFYLDNGKTLVYNYLIDEWSTNTHSAESSAIVLDQLYILKNGSVFQGDSGYQFNGSYYSLKVRTPWLKISSLQGFQRVYRGIVTGNYVSPHTLTLRVYTDYDESSYDEHTIDVTSDQVYNFAAHIANQKCTSIMFEIFDNVTSGGESMELNALTVQFGVKKGTSKVPASKRF